MSFYDVFRGLFGFRRCAPPPGASGRSRDPLVVVTQLSSDLSQPGPPTAPLGWEPAGRLPIATPQPGSAPTMGSSRQDPRDKPLESLPQPPPPTGHRPGWEPPVAPNQCSPLSCYLWAGPGAVGLCRPHQAAQHLVSPLGLIISLPLPGAPDPAPPRPRNPFFGGIMRDEDEDDDDDALDAEWGPAFGAGPAGEFGFSVGPGGMRFHNGLNFDQLFREFNELFHGMGVWRRPFGAGSPVVALGTWGWDLGPGEMLHGLPCCVGWDRGCRQGWGCVGSWGQ